MSLRRNFWRYASPNFTANSKPHVRIFSAFFSSSTSTQQKSSIPKACPGNETGIGSRIYWRVPKPKYPENLDLVVSFLKEKGFSSTELEYIAKNSPSVLYSNLEQTIKPKFKLLQDLGLSPAQVTILVSGFPRMLNLISETNMERSIRKLKKAFGSSFDDERLLRHMGWFMKYDLDNTLLPNIAFLKSCGLSLSVITKFCSHFPLTLMRKEESFKEIVRRVDEMGLARESKMYMYGIRTIASLSVENWEQKLDLFRSLGFSESNIKLIFRIYPNVFAVSKKKIKDMAEFLVSSGRYDASIILKLPTILTSSIEKRMKPRLRVLEILDSKEILKFDPSLTVYSISHAMFFEKYVSPYLDQVAELSFMVAEAHAKNPLNNRAKD